MKVIIMKTEKNISNWKLRLNLGNYNVKRYQLSKFQHCHFLPITAKTPSELHFNFFKAAKIGLLLLLSASNWQFQFLMEANEMQTLLQQSSTCMKLNNNVDQLKESIDNDVAQSRINMKSAILTMDAQKKNIDLAQQVYNSTKLKYEQGVGSNQEISTAQADLVTAQNNYYSSLYDAIIAKIDYLKATGKL